MTRAPTARLIVACALVALRSPTVSATHAFAQTPAAGAKTVSQTGTAGTGTPARAESNDNRLAGGVLRDGVLSIHLVAQLAAWYPEANDGPHKVVEAFGEAGQASSVPGPLIRIPLGATIAATVTNSLADTLVVLGLRGRNDSLRIAPNGVAKLRYKPPAAGSFLYAAGEVREGRVRVGGAQGQLVGGLIVDP